MRRIRGNESQFSGFFAMPFTAPLNEFVSWQAEYEQAKTAFAER